MLLHHLFKELVLIEVATSSDIWPIADRAFAPTVVFHGFPSCESILCQQILGVFCQMVCEMPFFVVKDEVPAVKVPGFARALFTQIPELCGNHWKPVDTQGFPKAPPVHKSGSQGLETEVLSTKKGANLSSPTVNFP